MREDDFEGDNARLISSIDALLDLDDAKALVPHGLGGRGAHAYRLLVAARARLSSAAQLRSAFAAQTELVDRLCDAVDREAADIGGESSLSVLQLLGPNLSVSRAALAEVPANGATSEESRLGAALLSVWFQARENHQRYSVTGDDESDLRFLTLGMVGEAGEAMEAVLGAALVVMSAGKVANLVKKRWRDGDGHEDEIRKELADVLAYAFMLADRRGITPAVLLETIAEKQRAFIGKMEERAALKETASAR